MIASTKEGVLDKPVCVKNQRNVVLKERMIMVFAGREEDGDKLDRSGEKKGADVVSAQVARNRNDGD